MSDELDDELRWVGLEDVLLAEELEQYQAIRKALWDSLVRVHTNLSLIRQINALPWIGSKGVRGLFGYMAANLLEHSVVIVHRIWADRDAGSMTLHRLARLLLTGSRPERADAVKARLRRLRAVKPSQDVMRRLGRIRNKNLAHLDEEYYFDPDQRLGPVSLDELEDAAKALAAYYNGLNIGSTSSFVIVNYEWSEPEDGPLGYVHELVAARSSKSSRFDSHPEHWARHVRPGLGDEELARLNKARRRADLPPMD